MYFEKKNAAVLSDMDYMDVQNLAQTGEGTFLEFKRTVPSALKIAREMAAFANARGGTLLVGVDDDKTLVGVKGYQEEEYLLNEAAQELCNPSLDITIEIVQFGERDLMVIQIPEAPAKPVMVQSRKGPVVYIREDDESRAVSRERVKILEHKYSGEGITFQYGADEQKLFRYLNEYSEISVIKLSHLLDVNENKASNMLVNLVSAGILNLFTKDNIDYFTFAPQSE